MKSLSPRPLLLPAAGLLSALFFSCPSFAGDLNQTLPPRSAILLAQNSSPPSSGRQPIAADLDAIRQQITQERREIDRLLKKQGSILEKLSAVKASIREGENRLNQLAARKEVMAAEMEKLAAESAALKRKMEEKRRLLSRRMRVRWRLGRSGLLRLLFGSEDIAALSRRRKFLEVLFAADRRRLQEYHDLLAEWKKAEARLAGAQEELAAVQAVTLEQQKELKEEKQRLSSMLAQIREEKTTHEQLLAELRANERQLVNLLARIERTETEKQATESKETEKEPPPPPGDQREIPLQEPSLPRQKSGSVPVASSDFASRRGKLCAPVPGPVLSGFGRKIHPEFNTVIMQNGIEIGAPAGTPVRTPAPGVVRFAQWFKGYGNLIILDHGGSYYTIYAHLNEIGVSVGQTVSEGEKVGAVGSTGLAGSAALYFEIRHHREALDPASWLGGCVAGP